MPVPTLIVGLGGTGSHITNSIARLYQNSLDARLKARFPAAFMAFDTDINDLGKLDALDEELIFQTSNKWTVGEYISHYGERIREWFPVEEKDLYPKSLLEGAGQIRVLSRLAFYNMMQDPLFQQRIANGVQKLMRLSTGELANLRIYLVGSLSGGTGSGIFSQIAIWFARKFSTYHPVIKGILFMPDIYVHAFGLPANQHVNVKANAYAAIKEIEALLATQADLTGRPFELEYDPLAPDKTIHPNEEILSMLYLIDYETSSGSPLDRNHEVYEEMVIKGIFNQLFTEMGASQRSVEDNNIISRTLETRTSKKICNYCTFGVAALEYPYEDIVDYLAHQFSVYSISEKWLAPDAEFETLLREYRRLVESGAGHAQPPAIELHYPEILRRYALAEGDPFFRPLYTHYRETRLDSAGQEVEFNLIDEFTRRIDEFLQSSLQHEQLFASTFSEYPSITGEYLGEAASRSGEIRDHDNKLADLRNNMEEPVQAVAGSVFRIITRAGDELSDGELKEHHLQYYVRKGGGAKDFPHPISVRHFLYELQNRLQAAIRPLEAEVKGLHETIRAYNQGQTITDDKTGASITENNEQRMARLEEKNALSRLLSGELKEFTQAYVHQANNHGNNMKQYVILKTRLELYRKLTGEAAELAREYGLFFDALRPTLDAVRRRIAELERYHEIRQAGACTQYVLASREQKRRLWEEYRDGISTAITPAISRQIIEIVTDTARRRQARRFSLQDELVMQNYKEKFVELIIPFNRQSIKRDLAARIDLNIAEAIRKELEADPALGHLDSVRWEDHFHQRVKHLFSELRRRADGYLMYVNPDEKEQMLFFGMHTDVHDSFTRTVPDFHGLIQADSGDKGVTDGFFSRYIVQAYRIHHTLRISNIRKFAYPAGDYHLAYRKRTDAVNSAIDWQDQTRQVSHFSNEQFSRKELPEGIIVHIDKSWHKPGLIGELDAAEQQNYLAGLRRAAVCARVYGLMEAKADREEVALIYNAPGEERKSKRVERRHSSDLLHLLDFLQDNPGLVGKLLVRAHEAGERERQRFRDEIREYTLDQRLNEVKEELARAVLAERGNPAGQKSLFTLVAALLTLFKELIQEVIPGDRNDKRDYFMNRYDYFIQKRGPVKELRDEEYDDFLHACESVELTVN
jgi:hypothetical protein